MSDEAVSSLIELTPRQARELSLDAIESGCVPFLRSSPGLGKSAIYRSIAEHFNLELIDHRLSTSAPEDLSGLPEFYDDEMGTRKARFVPFGDLFPTVGTKLPKGKDGWMLFLDEFNHADKGVQAAAYKLILDHMTGQQRLHERVIKTAAGNLDTDRAMTNPISTAMQSRVVTLRMRYDWECLRDDVIIPQNWDIRILTFLSQYPTKGMNFRADHNDDTFACPRTWEFLNNMITGKTFNTVERIVDGVTEHYFEMQRKLPMYCGTIGPGIATEFVNYCRVWGQLPTVQEIIADPMNVNVPSDPNLRWAAVGLMSENTEASNFGELASYADRFPINIRVLYYRIVIHRQPALRTHPVFRQRMGELSRYLNS